MAFAVWQRTITDDAGNVLASASVEVRDATSGALASIYSDRAGTTALSNPMTADANGFAQFYVAGGRYNITATSGSDTALWENVLLGTAQGYDVGTGAGQVPTNAVVDIALGAALNRSSLDDFTNANPLYIAHRNQAQLYPDQSLGAFRLSAESPYVHALECDVRQLSDGTLVNFHDATVDRVTTSTGSVEALDAGSFKSLYIDAENWHGANIPDGNRPTFFKDVLREFKGKKLFAIEVKTSGAGQAIVDALVAEGIPTDQAIVASFDFNDLSPAAAAGYPVMPTVSDANSIAAAQSLGATWVALGDTGNDADVTAWINAGFKVVMWTVNRRYRRDHLLDLGVVGFYSDDVEYLARTEPMFAEDQFHLGTWMPGMLAKDNSLDEAWRGRFFPDGSWGWNEQTTNGETRRYVVQGWAGPLGTQPGDEFCVYFRARHGEREVDSRWAGLYYTDASMGDRAPLDDGTDTYANGYNVVLSSHGNLDVYRVDSGIPTRLAELKDVEPESLHLIEESGEVLYKFTVTPTEVRVAMCNPDGTIWKEVSAADSTYRGGYIALGGRNVAARFRDLQIFRNINAMPRCRGDAVDTRLITDDQAQQRYSLYADGRMEFQGWRNSVPISGNTSVSVDAPRPMVGTAIAVAMPWTPNPDSFYPITWDDADSSAVYFKIHRTTSVASAAFRYSVWSRWK